MTKTFRKGAAGALLDEYEKAFLELQQVLNDITDEELLHIADSTTTDDNCRSIQTILSHVVESGYAYAIYIQTLKGNKPDFPEAALHLSVKAYQDDLNAVFAFTADTFANISDSELETQDNSRKLVTSWGQLYDIEQITEHAIVHILRHRRQIEKFRFALQSDN